MIENPTLSAMRPNTDRTEYGERVLLARKHAKMTQTALAKVVGMSQGTLAEAEKLAMGSVFTAQIAKVTGVNAEWLATGEGDMLGSRVLHQVNESPAAYSVITPDQAIATLAVTLRNLQNQESREAAGMFLQRMAQDPRGRWADLLSNLIAEENATASGESVKTDRSGKHSSEISNSPPTMKQNGPHGYGPALTKALEAGEAHDEINRPGGVRKPRSR